MSVAASDAPSSVVVRDPFPLRAIPSKVLAEEDYTEAVGKIIERDFFPDLPHLRLKGEMVKALAAGERELAQALHDKLQTMARPTPLSNPAVTPGATPRSATAGETPRPEEAQERAQGLSAWERDDDLESVTSRVERPGNARLKLVDGHEVLVDLSHVRIDDFQRVFTSEDNSSFESILARDFERKKQLQWWIEGTEKEHNTIHKAQVRRLEANGSLEKGELMFQPHSGRNGIFLNNCSEPQEPLEKPLVEFKNTRFTTKQQVELDCMLSAALVSRKARLEGEKLENAFDTAARTGSFEMPSLTAPGQRALGGRLQSPLPNSHPGPEFKGFTTVKTPNLLPGVDGLSPMMTFGKLVSTPKMIDDDLKGPNFKIQDVSDRELAAERLQRGATQRQRESKQLTRAERLRALGITPTTPGRSTPSSSVAQSPSSSKITPMSPIGQLIQRAQKLSQQGGQLRINSGSSGRPGSAQEPAAKRARCEKSGDKLPDSITDGLL